MANYSDLSLVGRPYALALSIEGCPYVFTSGGVASVSHTSASRDEDWCNDYIEWTVLDGYLDASAGIGWTERVRPIDGELEVGNIAFRIFDQSPTSGPSAGYPVMSWLAAREDVTSTTLTATAAYNTGSITVADGSIFPASGDFVLWIDNAAYLASTRSGDTIPLYTDSTGVYGSRRSAHYVDAANGYYPEVFATIPSLDRRRVVLWRAPLIAGVFTDPVPVWRGYITVNGLRLASSGPGRAAIWELACDHIVTRIGEATIGAATATCTIQGYANAQPHSLFWAKVEGHTSTSVDFQGAGYMQHLGGTSTLAYYPTLAEMCASVNIDLSARIAAAGLTSAIHVTANGRTVTLTGNVTNGQRLTSTLFLATRSPASTSRTIPESTDGNIPDVAIENFPLALAGVSVSSSDPKPVHMASVDGLPATGWPFDSAGLVGSLTATAGDYRIELTPTFADAFADTVVDTTNRTVKGFLRFYRGSGTTPLPIDGNIPDLLWVWGSDVIITAPLTFRFAAVVDTTNWVDGLRLAISGPGYYFNGAPWPGVDVDNRDWDWSRADRVAAVTPPLLARRHWLFDGTADVRSVLATNEQFSGGAPGLRRSRIAPDVFMPPAASDAFDAAHTFECGTGGDMLELPGWASSPDGICNSVSCKLGNAADSGTTTWVLQDQRSVARFGTRRKIELDLRGLEATAEILAQGPRALQSYLAARVMALWAKPTKVARIKTSLSRLDTVYLMDAVQVNGDRFLPNSAGGRGWDETTGVVVAREIRLTGADAGITYEVLHWPYSRLGGWAPCVRVATSNAATSTITVATGYVSGASAHGTVATPTDYANSGRTGYANASVGSGTVANDGGTGYFVAGDQCELLLRDATTAIREILTIDTVGPAAKTITFTTAQAATWAAYIAAGYPVDLRYVYDYEAAVEGQQRYAWVGDRASHSIESNADHPNKQWSP